MKLSIIIALYNTEEFIEKAIRSLYVNEAINSDEFEVLVVNDGSTDGSQLIVEKLVQEFNNIVLINKINGGQSTARNVGFKMAKGDYIFCLDSDDSINSDELKISLDFAISNNLDMLPVYFNNNSETGELLPSSVDNYPVLNDVINGADFLNRFVISGTMWRYFYKRKIINDHELSLIEGTYHEDEDFVIKFLTYVERIAYKRHLVYNYTLRTNSTVNNKNKEHRKKLLGDLLKIIISLNQHRIRFEKGSKLYVGLSKKVEQLLISLFFRMKQDAISYQEAKIFIDQLEDLELYPLIIIHQKTKFKIAAYLFNNKYLCRLYFR